MEVKSKNCETYHIWQVQSKRHSILAQTSLHFNKMLEVIRRNAFNHTGIFHRYTWLFKRSNV